MEIKYTTFKVDTKIYPDGEICGLIDKSGDFLQNNFYDIRVLSYNKSLTANFFLKFASKKKALINEMCEELEIRKELLKRKLKTLSDSELLKFLVIKVLLSKSKTVILDSIDVYLNYGDLKRLLKMIKSHIKEFDKTIIFKSNNIDNLIGLTDRYIIAEDGKIFYNGKDLKKIPVAPSTVEFTRLANKKGAKLNYYEDINDLLKAIYRDIK